MSARLFGRWDAAQVRSLLDEHGVLAGARARDFTDFRVDVGDVGDPAITHTRLFARKGGRDYLLCDACLTETRIAEPPARLFTDAWTRPVELMVVYWFSEQDPTRSFSPGRKPLAASAAETYSSRK